MSAVLLLFSSMALAGPAHTRRSLDLPPFEARAGDTLKAAVEMPDGLAIPTTVQLPRGDGPWPVVFIRSPYPMGALLKRECSLYVRYGYACAWQIVRGRDGVGGDWEPFVNERADGLASLDWIIGQPWSDGNIAMIGASYMGGVQWAMADALPPEVKTLVPMVFGTDMYRNLYEGGLFRHELVGAFMRLVPDEGFYFLGGRGYQEGLYHRPRREMDVVATGSPVPWSAPWMDAQLRSDAYWQADDVQVLLHAPEQIDIPVLLIAGWSDAFLSTQLDTWTHLATQADSTLIIGPWEHLGRIVGDIDIDNVDDSVGLEDSYFQVARVIDWFDHHLKGRPAAYPTGAAISYVVNDNRWATRPSWPPPTTPQTWTLSDGDAAGCAAPLGASAQPGVVQYTYDPADPTPSLGGAGSLAGVLPSFHGVAPGFLDQKDLCAERADMVGWVSPPLEAPLHIAGAVSAELAVSSTAPDTAFNVRILDVQPDGAVIHVREGIRALSFRDGDDHRAPYTPGDTAQLTVETWPVEYVFQPGSRVMVQLASASFPKFEAHTNTTEYWADAVDVAVATQSIHLAESRIHLPVVSAEAP